MAQDRAARAPASLRSHATPTGVVQNHSVIFSSVGACGSVRIQRSCWQTAPKNRPAPELGATNAPGCEETTTCVSHNEHSPAIPGGAPRGSAQVLAPRGNRGTSKAEIAALDGEHRALAEGGLTAGELFSGAELFRVSADKLIGSAQHRGAPRVGSWWPESAAPCRTAPQQRGQALPPGSGDGLYFAASCR